MKEYENVEEIEAEYNRFSNILIERIAMREELQNLLKIAKPEKISEIRQGIALFNESIEQTERCLESFAQLRAARIEFDQGINDLIEMTAKIKPKFLKHVAEHHPDRLEEMEELFSDDQLPTDTAH